MSRNQALLRLEISNDCANSFRANDHIGVTHVGKNGDRYITALRLKLISHFLWHEELIGCAYVDVHRPPYCTHASKVIFMGCEVLF